MKAARIALAVAGIVAVLYGAGRILFSVPPPLLVVLGLWLVGAWAIQHGVVSPLVVGVGVLLRRLVPDRGRRFLQAGLIVAALVTVVAIPLIARQGTQPPAKALLLQNYATNLTLLLGLVAGVTLVAYAVRVARDRTRSPEPGATRS
ncbi:MAG TPA: hypothetical protein VE617_12245 [Propionibacteriaceae bacterium]|nr:hypothetical protein [Propionibacteriaceae bacterium]